MGERIVAWMSDHEWVKVYKSIFYGNSDDHYHALDLINVWRVRFFGRIPVAIEATARLVEALLEQNNVTEGARKQILSASIAQFVGLMTEKGLKSQCRRPIHAVGEDIGIPEWLVNLRHEMAHGPLPSLIMMEKAVYFALHWIKENHWDIQAEKLPVFKTVQNHLSSKTVDRSILEQEIFNILYKFTIKLSEKPSHGHITKNCVNQIVSVVKKTETAMTVLCSVLSSHCFFDYPTVDCPKDFVMPHSLLNVWKPIIELIKEYSCLYYLFDCLISQLVGSNNDRSRKRTLITTWALFILNLLKEQYGVEFINYYNDTDGHLWIKFIRFMLLNVNPYTARLYKELTPHITSIVGAQNGLLLAKLYNISESKLHTQIQSMETGLESTPGKIHTINSVCARDKHVEASPEFSGCRWTRFKHNNLQNCSIGLLPGQTPALLSLHLSGFNDKNVEKNDLAPEDLPIETSSSLDYPNKTYDHYDRSGENPFKHKSSINTSKDDLNVASSFIDVL
ncbi:uncharacterized protein LOC143445800 [Clavelina lepadiformis]|uniref:uncharacterized protein LOC143445800 n=1 Tax=Clavelina lepadiformis TaxID=159417 RepID=UPI00404220BE